MYGNLKEERLLKTCPRTSHFLLALQTQYSMLQNQTYFLNLNCREKKKGSKVDLHNPDVSGSLHAISVLEAQQIRNRSLFFLNELKHWPAVQNKLNTCQAS